MECKQILPNEVWSEIMNYCSPSSLNILSKVNKQIREVALERLNKIRISANELTAISIGVSKIFYRITYENFDFHRDITDLDKFILLKVSNKNGSIHVENLIRKDDDPKVLESNQIKITPTFGEAEYGKILSENNPNYGFFGFGLKWQESTVLEDRLPIKGIKVESEIQNSDIQAVINLSQKQLNKIYELKSSYLRPIMKWILINKHRADLGFLRELMPWM